MLFYLAIFKPSRDVILGPSAHRRQSVIQNTRTPNQLTGDNDIYLNAYESIPGISLCRNRRQDFY